jgi:putative cardiolipin synthase
MLHDMGTWSCATRLLAQVDRHPRIEIRVFNAWRERTLLGRAAESVADFERLNRRMHNKQMIADNRAAVIGGRNIGDEYFGLNPQFNFHDLDVLGVGPVARQASAVFDRYWNSDWVRRIPKRDIRRCRDPPPSAAEPRRCRLLQPRPGLAGTQCRPAHVGRRDGRSGARHCIQAAASRCIPTRRRAATTSQPHARSVPGELMRSRPARGADHQRLHHSRRRFMDDLRELGARGVKVRILTNSLASHDVPAVNSHYEGWRRADPATGARLAARTARRRRRQGRAGGHCPQCARASSGCTPRPW